MYRETVKVFFHFPFVLESNLLNWKASEERLKKLEGNDQSNSVSLALRTLHRTIENTRFDPEDAILDLEALFMVATVILSHAWRHRDPMK